MERQACRAQPGLVERRKICQDGEVEGLLVVELGLWQQSRLLQIRSGVAEQRAPARHQAAKRVLDPEHGSGAYVAGYWSPVLEFHLTPFSTPAPLPTHLHSPPNPALLPPCPAPRPSHSRSTPAPLPPQSRLAPTLLPPQFRPSPAPLPPAVLPSPGICWACWAHGWGTRRVAGFGRAGLWRGLGAT